MQGQSTRAAPLRTIQVVLLALMGGLAVITAVALAVRGQSPPQRSVQLLLGAAVGASAVVAVVVYPLVRRKLMAQLAARPDQAKSELNQGQLPGELSALAIVGAALAEGPGISGAIGFLLTRQRPFLAAPVLAVLLIALQIPTRERAQVRLDRARHADV